MNLTKGLRAERLIAKRYEERGYSVTLEPPPAAIPFPLGSYHPDILATRGDEHLIIDVKSAGARVDPEVYFELDGLIQKHPGWRFLLVTVTEAELEESVSNTSINLSSESIRARLRTIDRLVDDAELTTFVLPTLWTAYVAALGLLLENEAVPINGYTDLSLLNKAYSAGSISFDEYEAGRALMSLRNRAVHSLDILGTPAECRQLRKMIDDILDRLMPTAAATMA